MTKYDLIKKILQDIGPMTDQIDPPFSDEPDYEEHVLETLHQRLPEDVDIKICDDFKHLGVECCDCCHGVYAHYEMSLIDLPDGGKAWVCDDIKWAIYPEERKRVEQSGAYKELRKILGGDKQQ